MIGSLKIRWKEKYLPIFLLVDFYNWTLDNYAALIGVIVREVNCYLAINIVIFVTKYWLMHLHQSHARYMYHCYVFLFTDLPTFSIKTGQEIQPATASVCIFMSTDQIVCFHHNVYFNIFWLSCKFHASFTFISSVNYRHVA